MKTTSHWNTCSVNTAYTQYHSPFYVSDLDKPPGTRHRYSLNSCKTLTIWETSFKLDQIQRFGYSIVNSISWYPHPPSQSLLISTIDVYSMKSLRSNLFVNHFGNRLCFSILTMKKLKVKLSVTQKGIFVYLTRLYSEICTLAEYQSHCTV